MKNYIVAEEVGLKTPSGTLVLDNSGNVGIGSTNPGCLLEIYGTNPTSCIKASSGTSNMEIISASNNLSFIDFSDGNDFNGRILYNNSTDKFHFYVSSGTEAVIIGSTGNVGIGTNNPATSAKLEISSTTGGLLLPRMTTTQRDALTGTDGLMIFNTTTNTVQCYYSSTWNNL